MKTKTCIKCKEVKPILGFSKNRTKKGGLQGQCKVCGREYSRKYYENNREKRIEQNRRWRESNREQNNRKGVKIEKEINSRSLELAHRQHQPWEDWEDEFVLADNGLTMYQKAAKLGRSYSSVRSHKVRLKQKANA